MGKMSSLDDVGNPVVAKGMSVSTHGPPLKILSKETWNIGFSQQRRREVKLSYCEAFTALFHVLSLCITSRPLI